MFRRPLGWFVLTVAFLALAVFAAFAYMPFIGYPALWFAGWSFAVWTVAIGVRVGLSGLRLETAVQNRPADPRYPYNAGR